MHACEDGTVTILAFDKDYKDNEGVYEIEFSVLRGADAGTAPV